MYTLPWLFSLTTAVWFGVMARRVRRNWLLWGTGGALLGLVSTTVIEGVNEAAFVAVSHHAVVLLRLKIVAMDMISVGFLGWLLTFDLRRRNQALRKQEQRGNVPERAANPQATLPQPTPRETGPGRSPSPARAG